MDLIRAQHLLTKIQSFLEDGNGSTLSRLEKDLLKSYVIQLYDTLTEEAPARQNDVVRAPEMPASKINYPDLPPVYGTKTIIPEPEKKVTSEPETREEFKTYPEIKIPVMESLMTIDRPEPKPVRISVEEPVLKVVHQPEPTHPLNAVPENLKKLFEIPFADDVSGMFTRVPVASIESALGLNERIFTLNELFGGNKALFDSTCVELNALHSYAEATDLLLRGAASQFDWSDPARIKMAEHFIRIVARRYPRN
jgi:hypothetical protein